MVTGLFSKRSEKVYTKRFSDEKCRLSVLKVLSPKLNAGESNFSKFTKC
jgi:hypothetical protein